MENLFRLVLTRPPVIQDENAPSIRLAQDSAFQTALAQAQQNQNPRRPLKAAARQFMTTPNFVGDPTSLPIHAELKALGAKLDTLEKNASVSNAKIASAIEDQFGEAPAKLIDDHTLDSPTADVKDSLIAIKLIPEEHGRPVEELTRQLRDLELIRKVAADSSFPATGANLRRYRRRSVMLPTQVDLRSILSTLQKQKELEEQRKEEEEKKRQSAEAKLELYKRLTTAIGELTTLHNEHLHVTPQKADPGFLVPDAFRPNRLVMQEITQREQVSKLDVLRLESAIKVSEKVDVLTRFRPAEGLTAETSSKRSLSELFVSGKAPFTPLVQGETAFRFKPEVEQLLSPSTQELLKQRGLSVSVMPLDTIVERLRAEIMKLTTELDTLLGRPVQRSLKRFGNTMVMTSIPMASVWNNLVVSGNLTTNGIPLPFEMSVPTSHGSIAPAGIADLLVVRQQLVRYEGADVAHIENVLKSEKKTREHTTRRETEEFNLRETETTTSEERELESTTRFEMSRETSQTIREDAALKAGLTVSGKYGPTVEFSASAEGSVSRSKEEATKTAATLLPGCDRAKRHQDHGTRPRAFIAPRDQRSDRQEHPHARQRRGHGPHLRRVPVGQQSVSGADVQLRHPHDVRLHGARARCLSHILAARRACQRRRARKTCAVHAAPGSNHRGHLFHLDSTVRRDRRPAPAGEFKTKSVDFKAGGGEHGTNYNHSGQLQIDEGTRPCTAWSAALKNIWESHCHRRRGSRFTHAPVSTAADWVWSTTLNEETRFNSVRARYDGGTDRSRWPSR